MSVAKKHILSFIILSLFFAFNLLVLCPSYAATNPAWDRQIGIDQVGEKYGETGGEMSEGSTLEYKIINVVNRSLQFLAVIFLILLLIAGIKWMTSQGSEDKISEAQGQIRNAIIGLVIVLMAWSITYFILRELSVVATNSNFRD